MLPKMNPVKIVLKDGLINRSISKSEILQIKNAKNINQVSSTMGKILDFLCGTRKEEAKELVFKLTHDENSKLARYEYIYKLRQLSTVNKTLDEYMENLKEHINNEIKSKENNKNNDKGLNLEPETINITDCETVTEEMNKISPDDVTDQFNKDISRSDYYVNGDKVEPSEISKTFENNIAAQRGLSQSLFALVLNHLYEKYNINMYVVPNVFGTVTYETTFNEDGTATIIATSSRAKPNNKNDMEIFIDEHDAEYAVRSLEIKIKVTVDKDKINVDSITHTIIR